MKVSSMLACSFPSWYPHFRKVTPRSRILPLPEDVLLWLRDPDTLRLPKESDSEWHTVDKNDSDSDTEEVEETNWEEQDEDEEGTKPQPEFPEFSQGIRTALSDLGGKVFIKLNWSSPRDATWVTLGNNLSCSDLMQVYLLLKSSEFVAHDLSMPFKDCDDVTESAADVRVEYALVLRSWRDINPGHEFRCFVRDGRLISVVQRDCSKYYEHIMEDESSIVGDVKSFYQEQIQEKFPLKDYTFDIVRPAKDKVTLLDFGPFGPPTDPLLFSWQDLRTSEFPTVEFRAVEDDAGIQPSGLRQFSLPTDIVDLSTGADPDKLVDFLKLQGQRQDNEGNRTLAMK